MEGPDQKPSPQKNFFSAISHDLLSNPRKDDYKHIAALLKNVSFFKRIFPDFIELHDFVHLSKQLFTYETHSHGTIISKKGDYAEKFYIVLKGEVQKFQQRKYKEIEEQLKHQMSHRASYITQDTSRLLSNQSPIGAASFKRSGKNKRTLTWFTNDSTKIFNNNNMQTSIDVSNGDIASPGSESPINMERKFRRSNTRTKTFTFPSANEIPQDDPESLNFDNMALINQIRSHPSEDQQVKKERPRLGSQIKLIPRTDPFPKFSPSRASHLQDFSDLSFEFPGLKMSATSPSPTKDFSPMDVSNIVEPKDENTTNLLTRLILKHPEIRHTCFIHNIPLLTSMKILQPGDHFGENSCKKVQGREPVMTVVSSEEVILLGINRNDFRNIIDTMDKEANIRADFFKKLLHGVEENLIKTFSQYFKKINLPKSHTVYQQNDPATAFYIIQSGEVELSKENPRSLPKSSLPCISPTSHRKTIKQELSIALVGNDQFFGEELLFEEQLRNYTATVKSPSLECYCLEENLYSRIKDRFKEIFQEIKLQSNTKLKWRKERLSGLVETSPQMSPTRTVANEQVLELFKLLSINASESRSKLSNFRNVPMPGTPKQASNSNNSSPISAQLDKTPREDQALAKTLKSYKDNYSRKTHLSLKLYLAEEQPQSAEKPQELSPGKISLNSPTNPTFLDFGVQLENKKPLRAKKLTLIKTNSNPNPPILSVGSPRMQKIILPNDSITVGKVTPLQPNKWGDISNMKTMTEFNPYLPGNHKVVTSPRTQRIQQNKTNSTTIFGFEEKMHPGEEELQKEVVSAGSSPIDKREFKKLRELIHYKSINELQGKLRKEKKEKYEVVNIHTQEPINKSRRQTK